MLYLTKLHLENFCNYEHHTFDFKRSDGSAYPYICFYGPNGVGKSTILEAISLLTANQSGRGQDHVKQSMKKYVRNKDYDPSYNRISGHIYKDDFIQTYENNLPEMVIEGTYEMEGQTYIVRLNQNGFERNDLAPEGNGPGPWGNDHLFYRQRVAHFTSSDSDLSMSKFQLKKNKMTIFEEIASTIMRFPVQCISPSGLVNMDQDYCTDFILVKNGHKIHYKRMSAGEKKISKTFSQLLNLIDDLENPDPGDPSLACWPRLLLFDNIEMHIYYDRHVAMVDCMKNHFHQQQIFATTHSGELIRRFLKNGNDAETELIIDLEKIN